MKTLIFLLFPFASFSQQYISAGLAASTHAAILHVETGYVYKYAIVELAGVVPLDQRTPIAAAFHAGVSVPLGKWSIEALAGPEYHYQELYKEKIVQRKIQPSGRLRVLLDNPVEEDNLRLFAGVGWAVGGVMGEAGIRVGF